jgi:predicted  nucleic acid-binding Zn-ribbon protein
MAVSASSAEQNKLLEIADLDTKLIQLNHQRSTAPQITKAHDLEVELGSIEMKIVAAQTEVADLTVNQEKAEADVKQVADRISKDQSRLDAGQATPKELEGFQHEIATLSKRLTELEDEELIVMQQLEDATSALSELELDRDRVTGEFELSKQALELKFADLDGQIAQLGAARLAAVESLPKDVVELYEKIKSDQGDVGAALIHRGACQGCHIALDATEIDRIKSLPPDTVVRCEQCRRILIRNSESGL